MSIPTVTPDFLTGRIAFFVTSNIHKFNEARHVLAEYKVASAMLKIEVVEIQDDNLERIAETTAMDALNKCGFPVIVEDSGLCIKALDGFPGPYSSYVYRTIGIEGILHLMENIKEREACFKSYVAYASFGSTLKCFQGVVKGEISIEKRGNSGFGFDPIFKPLGHQRGTFAEMTVTEKNKYSHRAEAMRKFAAWYRLHGK